jgi:predicted pyridoxine 5'-phosphate oxidase superfamily flavin-nucleotide-binding protein
MFSDELQEFLKKPHIARVSTIDADGYPHTVGIWYAIDGDELLMTTPRNAKKINHIQVNPKGSISIGGAPGDGGGWLFKGSFIISDEKAWPWLEQMTYHYETAEQAVKDLAEWASLDMVLIRMKPEKTIKFF